MWRKLSNRVRRKRVIPITAASVAGCVVLLSLTGWFQLLEWAILDRFFRLRPPEPLDDRIIIVGISEDDIGQLGQWPMSDEMLAQLLDRIQAQQPRAIGLDLYRDLPVEPGHQQLRDILQSTSNLIGIEKISGKTVAPPPDLASQQQLGIADLVVDADGKLRRGLISIGDGDGRIRLSLGATLALRYLEKEGITLQDGSDPGSPVRLGRARFQRFQRNDGGYVRANSGGYQILLNFRGPSCQDDRSACPFKMVSMTEILENSIDPDLMRDRLVFIGATAQSTGDFFHTPYSNSSATTMSGIEIHAHLTSQILSAALDGRSNFRTLPDPLEWVWIWVGSAGGAVLGAKFLTRRWMVISILVWGGGSISLAYGAFLQGWWLPGFTPILAAIGASAVSFTWILLLDLQESYRQLEDYAQNLEFKVRERTRELHRSEIALQAANQELQRLVDIDSLTQVANRRRFDEYLNRQWQHCLRHRLPLSLILCDVDYFKRYNDTYGHQQGDRCLQAVARAIANSVQRPADLVARYGGEEFAVILPETDSTGAMRVAQSIQRGIKQLAIPHESSEVRPSVTLSMGIATLIPRQDGSPDSSIAWADRELYRAKAIGRNTYCHHIAIATAASPSNRNPSTRNRD